jgi:cell division protein FtsQ
MSETASLGRRALLAFAGAIAIAAMAGGAWFGYRTVTSQPVKHVIFAGELDRLDHAELDALSQAIQAAPAASVTIASVREAARRVPWVREATVRRRFPDTVEITFEAHEAVARWNDHQLLDRHGEAFTAQDASELPRLRGPEGSGARMLPEFATLAKTLAPLGALRELRLSARGAWQALLDSGMVLELGRSDLDARAQRFVAAWPQASAHVSQPRYADLRYPNGFALDAGSGARAPGPSPGSPIPKEKKK